MPEEYFIRARKTLRKGPGVPYESLESALWEPQFSNEILYLDSNFT